MARHRRRTTLLLATLLAALAIAPLVLAAPASKGPFAGVVAEGSYQEHPYWNGPPPGYDCPIYPWGSYRPYRIVLTYEPPTDRVDLSFRGLHAAGSNGVATLSFTGTNCIGGSVYALGVATTAPYAAYQIQVVELLPLEWLLGPAL